MGGLLNYAPALWAAYASGALGLAGLPYWSGYYCKSALWAAAATSGAYWAVEAPLLLVNSLLTLLYLWRLGHMVFGGPKLGHRAAYRPHWLS